ncbi:hypothetical protein B566_EDAN005171 [Ephemera danica]|nr:hypothetical protein B566_EDAN005171 [Ephemera danica]
MYIIIYHPHVPTMNEENQELRAKQKEIAVHAEGIKNHPIVAQTMSKSDGNPHEAAQPDPIYNLDNFQVPNPQSKSVVQDSSELLEPNLSNLKPVSRQVTRIDPSDNKTLKSVPRETGTQAKNSMSKKTSSVSEETALSTGGPEMENLSLSEAENSEEDMKEEYDTRSEVTSPRSKVQNERDLKRKHEKSPINTRSTSPNYMTKLNYLFRDARFFVMKSNNAENVTLSKAKGVWSTPPQNETKLNHAFRESRNVLLIFSVKESGKFAGFARLSCESRRDVPPISWVLPPGLSARALGGVFKVDWICRKELQFTKTQHLYNPWNEGKPVKIGRDGQEIEPKVAEELCRLFAMDEGIDMTPVLRKSKGAARVVRPPQGLPPPVPMRNVRRGGNMAGEGEARGSTSTLTAVEPRAQPARSFGSRGGNARPDLGRYTRLVCCCWGGGGLGGCATSDCGAGVFKCFTAIQAGISSHLPFSFEPNVCTPTPKGWRRGRYPEEEYTPRAPKRSNVPGPVSSFYMPGHFKQMRRETSPVKYAQLRARFGVYTDFIRELHAQASAPVAPLPYPAPPPFEPMPLLRYYEGPPLPEYPPQRSSRADKRSYDRSVDEFLRRTSERRDKDRDRGRSERDRRYYNHRR